MSEDDGTRTRNHRIDSPVTTCPNEQSSTEVAAHPSFPLAHSLAYKVQNNSGLADLQLIVDAWPTLPEVLRAGMLAMVAAARKDG